MIRLSLLLCLMAICAPVESSAQDSSVDSLSYSAGLDRIYFVVTTAPVIRRYGDVEFQNGLAEFRFDPVFLQEVDPGYTPTISLTSCQPGSGQIWFEYTSESIIFHADSTYNGWANFMVLAPKHLCWGDIGYVFADSNVVTLKPRVEEVTQVCLIDGRGHIELSPEFLAVADFNDPEDLEIFLTIVGRPRYEVKVCFEQNQIVVKAKSDVFDCLGCLISAPAIPNHPYHVTGRWF